MARTLDYLLQRGRYSSLNTTQRPAIILCDLNMPGMNGKQFLAKIKSIESLKTIPVLIMTTSDSQEDIDECYQAGASTYITKPFDWPAFCFAVQKLKDYWLKLATLPFAYVALAWFNN